MPYKVFQDATILTASDVNTYMMNQQIAVFADSTARGSAIASPVEGQFAFLKNTDKLTYFDGSTWRNL